MTPLSILIEWISRQDDDVINQQYIQQKALMLLDREKEIMIDFAMYFDEFADREHVEQEWEKLFNQNIVK
jgi:hypothetical protein